MKYEIRYMLDNEERTQTVDGDSAAEAAETVRQDQVEDVQFELIQVSLIERDEAEEPVEA